MFDHILQWIDELKIELSELNNKQMQKNRSNESVRHLLMKDKFKSNTLPR